MRHAKSVTSNKYGPNVAQTIDPTTAKKLLVGSANAPTTTEMTAALARMAISANMIKGACFIAPSINLPAALTIGPVMRQTHRARS